LLVPLVHFVLAARALTFAVSAAVAQPMPARALPWCLIGPWLHDCSYGSFQQCLAFRPGTGGFCLENPRYQPLRPARNYHRRRR
jgi:hypothetical protein